MLWLDKTSDSATAPDNIGWSRPGGQRPAGVTAYEMGGLDYGRRAHRREPVEMGCARHRQAHGDRRRTTVGSAGDRYP